MLNQIHGISDPGSLRFASLVQKEDLTAKAPLAIKGTLGYRGFT